MNDDIRNAIEVTAVIARRVEEIGGIRGLESRMSYVEAILQLVKEVLNTWPPNYDWEAHYERGGVCWDMEVEDMVDMLVLGGFVGG